MAYKAGDWVHVPGFGTGVVREARNGGRYVVEIKGRAMVVGDGQLSGATAKRREGREPSSTPQAGADPPPRMDGHRPTLDLHGCTVDEALDRLDRFLNEALLSGAAAARVIHGRSGGRIKAAVHTRLKGLPSVRHFRVDPQNAGVTLVTF